MSRLTKEEILDLHECNRDGEPVVYLNTPERMRQLCDLALQSLSQESASRADKVLVPREPTKTMKMVWQRTYKLGTSFTDCYTAMLAAAEAEGKCG